MLSKYWLFLGSIIFFLAALKTFMTKEIVGKAGYINLGEYVNLVVFFLLGIGFILFYLGLKTKET